MSEMTSIVEQQQQQYVVGVSGSSDKSLCCKDCGMNFDSSSSLEVHLRYHQENLMSQWANQTNQEESNNNNSKAGNHNSGSPAAPPSQRVQSVPLKRESVTAAADSSESSSSRPPSEDPTSCSIRLQQQQQQQHHHLHQEQQQQQQQQFNQHFSSPMFNDTQYFMHNETPYILSSQQQQQHHHHYSSDRPDEAELSQRGVTNYARYHPYQHTQHFNPSTPTERVNSVSSTSPRSPLQCDKCGAVYEDTNQLAEHVRTSHPGSPAAYAPPVQSQQPPPPPPPPPPQYQQLAAGSPQHQITQSQQNQAQQQHMHTSPARGQSNQQSGGYDFASGVIKTESKQEPEEQAEILDLDSHKVQTHRYEEEFMRLQQHQQEMHVHMQHQVMQQQQHGSRSSTHSVSSMLSWAPSASQPHDYHPGLSPMGPIDSVSPIQEQQNQFMRGQAPQQTQPQQHISPVESARHPNSPIITSTQSMPSHPMATGLMQHQNPKPPPLGNQSWKSNEARRPKTYNCTACNKWFTSSGHLKRHYNTTLHKNAVKQSNQPDPANMPISAHHHPGRDANSRGANTAASRSSPELSSSGSPPNLMAGPSGEATRGLLHTPTTNTTMVIFSNNNSSSSNSSEATAVQAAVEQKALEQQQQQFHHHQHQPSTVMLASNLMYLGSPRSSPMAQAQQHHHQQMGSSSPQLGQQQQPQAHSLPMSSPSQITGSAHRPMNSPMSPMQQHPTHMNSPSPMASHHHHHHHHHMSSPSPIMAGVVPSVMGSPPPGTMMEGTTMPHQPYPNALPPHVTTITSITGLLESITNQLTTTGNPDMHSLSTTPHQQQQEMLPSFGTFSNHQQQKPLPGFTQFGSIANGFIVGQNQLQAANVGGLSPEENVPPHERSFESPVSSYEIYRGSPPRYECLSGMEMLQSTDGPIVVTSYSELQQQQQQEQQEQQYQPQHQQPSQQQLQETNNNVPPLAAKEKVLNSRIVSKAKSGKGKGSSRVVTKEHQVTSTNTGSHYISENGLHKCIECDKVFNKACYLTQHNKSFHSGDKPFKCNQCGKRFPHEYLHAEHLQKHAGDKPYKCEICPKQFNHKTDLRRHMCLHTGEKPYACDKCGKGFIRKDHMMKHLDTHRKKNNSHKVHLRA